MKILVFGFSVTGESDGFVERCAAQCPEHEILKVAIGGMQPVHARHLISGILDNLRPDALVVEIATAAYRSRPGTEAMLADHKATIEFFFACCRDRGIRCGILDFPLETVKPGADWMADVHAQAAKASNVPWISVPLRKEILRDIVHPTDDGKSAYATHLFAMIRLIETIAPDFSGLREERWFSQYSMADTSVTGGMTVPYSRTGYEVDCVSIAENSSVEIRLPDKVKIIGFIMAMGPKTGTIQADLDGKTHQITCYDQHCYYQRLNGFSVPETWAQTIRFTQTNTVPTLRLIKGEKYMGPREGWIANILFELSVDKGSVAQIGC